MRHQLLPSTLTAEQLGKLIDESAVEKLIHVDEIPLTEEQIHEHEHKIALAARTINELEDLKKQFAEVIKSGTPVLETDPDGQERRDAQGFTIPPTKGVKVLKANVEYHSQILDAGHETWHTQLYLLPWPERKMMIAMDIEGQEYAQYSREMTEREATTNTTLFAEDAPLMEFAAPKRRQKKEKKEEDLAFGEEPVTDGSSFLAEGEDLGL